MGENREYLTQSASDGSINISEDVVVAIASEAIGEIEGDENAMDQYATSEVYKRALDRLVSQYPDNQTYQKLAADFAIYNG